MESCDRNNSEGTSTSSHTDEFITVNLEEDPGSCSEPHSCSEEQEILQKRDSERPKKSSEQLPPTTERSQEESLIANDEEIQISHLENQSPCNCGNSTSNTSSQVLPVSDFSPVLISSNPDQGVPSTNEVHRPFHIKRLGPGVGTSIVSFIMTAAFICILWLVVFMVFGYRGHAIAGVFVGLFLVGLLINTCFLKLYLRFKMFLGISAAVAAAERQQTAMQRHHHMQEKIIAEKAKEKPPSYATAVSSPPPYDLLQYYKQRKSTASMASFSSRASFYRKGHNCPFCKREVKIFGMCKPCKSSLTKT